MRKDNESKEMYLETILVLFNRNGYVRSIDISEELGYSRASVSRAMSDLKKEEFILVDKSHFIKLTEKGQELAEKILDRHRVISKMLMKLGVSEETAEEDACRIEHIISDETFEAVKNHYEEE